MNEKKMRFLLTAAFCVLTVLTVNAEATTADDQVCQAGYAYVCFTKHDDGTLAEIVTNGHGRAITVHEQCSNADMALHFGCQPVAAIRAEERDECDHLGGRWYWSTTRGGRCVEQQPREDDSPAPPPQTPPYTPPPQTPPAPPIVVITPPAPPGPGVTNPPYILPPVAPVPPGPPATCPDCILNAPNPCTDIPALAAEIAPLEQLPVGTWETRTDTDYVRSRVLYIRERAGECAEDGLFATAERILAAMTPPETVPLLPDNPLIVQPDDTCWDDWCLAVTVGAVAVATILTTLLVVWEETEFHAVQP